MQPDLQPGDRLRFDPGAYRRGSPAPGDLVIVRDPDGSGRRLVKAVAAVGPATVWVLGEGVVVAPLGEAPTARPEGALDELEVPAGHLFVLSRRPTGTRDSRTFGPVAPALVEGRVWYRYGPPERRGPVGPTRGSRPS
jgi:signal peptidase I